MSIKLSPVFALMPLHIVITSCPSSVAARVAVAGEVDLATAPALREALLDALHSYSPAVLDLDLAAVTFLDCAGIGALVAVHDAAVDAGCQLRVSNLQPIVHRVFDLTGLLDLFTAATGEPESRPAGAEYPPEHGPIPATVIAPGRQLSVA